VIFPHRELGVIHRTSFRPFPEFCTLGSFRHLLFCPIRPFGDTPPFPPCSSGHTCQDLYVHDIAATTPLSNFFCFLLFHEARQRSAGSATSILVCPLLNFGHVLRRGSSLRSPRARRPSCSSSPSEHLSCTPRSASLFSLSSLMEMVGPAPVVRLFRCAPVKRALLCLSFSCSHPVRQPLSWSTLRLRKTKGTFFAPTSRSHRSPPLGFFMGKFALSLCRLHPVFFPNNPRRMKALSFLQVPFFLLPSSPCRVLGDQGPDPLLSSAFFFQLHPDREHCGITLFPASSPIFSALNDDHPASRTFLLSFYGRELQFLRG